MPGSHLWDLNRQPTAAESVSAEMHAGDCLLWLGGTLHAAGRWEVLPPAVSCALIVVLSVFTSCGQLDGRLCALCLRNTTVDQWRAGVFVSYSLGFLRTEEHFAMELTPEAAAALPAKVRALCGFRMHRGLGFFSNDVHDIATTSTGTEDDTDGESKEWLKEWREAAAAARAAASFAKL